MMVDYIQDLVYNVENVRERRNEKWQKERQVKI